VAVEELGWLGHLGGRQELYYSGCSRRRGSLTCISVLCRFPADLDEFARLWERAGHARTNSGEGKKKKGRGEEMVGPPALWSYIGGEKNSDPAEGREGAGFSGDEAEERP